LRRKSKLHGSGDRLTIFIANPPLKMFEQKYTCIKYSKYL
jgi:hypothetical protein